MKKKIMYFILLILLPISGFSQSKYKIKCNKQLLETARQVMNSQVGILETTNRNDGEVEKYAISLGLPNGAPYCAAGIYWSFLQTCKQLGYQASSIPIPKTGLANNIYKFAVKTGNRTYYKASKHDLIIWRKSNSIFGHIESVYSVGKAGNVLCIGFNSSKIINGKRKEGVFYQKRNILHPIGKMKIRGIVGFGE